MDGTPPSEWPKPELDVPQHAPEFTRPHVSRPTKTFDELRVCSMGYSVLGSGAAIGKGTIVHSSHPAVREHPDYWQPFEVEVYG